MRSAISASSVILSSLFIRRNTRITCKLNYISERMKGEARVSAFIRKHIIEDINQRYKKVKNEEKTYNKL